MIFFLTKTLRRKGRDEKLYTTTFTYSAQRKEHNQQNIRVRQKNEIE